MKQKSPILIIFSLLTLGLMILVFLALTVSAYFSVTQETVLPVPTPTALLHLTYTTEPPTPYSVPPTPTAPTATSTAVATYPILITQGTTNVRLGPGMVYGTSHVLSAHDIVPIIGKNLDSTWWAVPGPGDGSGQHGWVENAVVTVQGDTSTVPFVAAPTLTPTPVNVDFPNIGNIGPHPIEDACVVTHPVTNDKETVIVRLGPGSGFAIAAELGPNRWAPIAEIQNGWYRIYDAGGLGGWVQETEVSLAGHCFTIESDPDLPPGVPLGTREQNN